MCVENTKKRLEQDKAEEFVKEYNELCKRYGYQWQVTPAWRYSQEGNDWRLILQPSLAQLSEDQKKIKL